MDEDVAAVALGLVLALSLPYLDLADLARVAQTCKSGCIAAKEDFLWHDLFKTWFGKHDFRFATNEDLSWKEKCKQATNALAMMCPAWYQITPAFPKQPIDTLPRQGHASCVVENLPEPCGWGFVVYGGYLANRQISNDVFVLCEKKGSLPKAYAWKGYELQGWINIRTYGHTITRVASGTLSEHCCRSDSLIVYGGLSSGGYQGELDRLYSIAITQDKCGELEFTALMICQENIATARGYHTTTLWDNKLYVFGGHNRRGPLTHLETFCLKSRRWTVEKPLGAAKPCARFGHSATLVNDKLIVCGGSTARNNMKCSSATKDLSDIWILEKSGTQHTWSSVTLPSSMPSNALLRCHSAVAIRDRLCIFGGGVRSKMSTGLTIVNTKDWTWRKLELQGEPYKRQNHSCAVLPSQTKLVFFGGCVAKNISREELGDTYILDLDHVPGEAKDGVVELTEDERAASDAHFDRLENPMSLQELLFNATFDPYAYLVESHSGSR